MKLRFIPSCLSFSLLASAAAFAAEPLTFPINSVEKLSVADGQEFSKAAGNAELAEVDGKTVVKINFDLTEGVYISAGFPVQVDETYEQIRFSAQADAPCKFALRVIDASGECFQYPFRNEIPGEPVECTADLHKEGVEHWGGDANGVLDQPVKSVHFLVSRIQGEPAKGTATFGDLVFE